MEAIPYPRRAQCQSQATLALFGRIFAWRFPLLSVICDCYVDCLFSSQPGCFTIVLTTPQLYNTLAYRRYPLKYPQPSPFSLPLLFNPIWKTSDHPCLPRQHRRELESAILGKQQRTAPDTPNSIIPKFEVPKTSAAIVLFHDIHNPSYHVQYCATYRSETSDRPTIHLIWYFPPPVTTIHPRQ